MVVNLGRNRHLFIEVVIKIVLFKYTEIETFSMPPAVQILRVIPD